MVGDQAVQALEHRMRPVELPQFRPVGQRLPVEDGIAANGGFDL